MTRWTMVAFVVVVRQDLPVIVTCHLPRVIELVIVEVELLTSLLPVDSFEIVVPGDLWLCFAVKIDPDQTMVINMDMDRKETVLCFVKSDELVVSRSLG